MRYVGSKTKIVDQIDKLIKNLKIDKENYTFFDAFSGTATVGDYFKEKFKIIANDSLYFSYVDFIIFLFACQRIAFDHITFSSLRKQPII